MRTWLTDRRQFLTGCTAVAVTAVVPPMRLARAAPSMPLVLEAREGLARLLEEHDPETAIWGYDGQVPGPTIRARQGDELWIRLVNRLPEPTTIHWHGIRIDNRMDGVAHLTQEGVAPGESFDYRFVVPDAGTFWYHPHVHGSGPQVERGLSGALIVDETVPVDVDRDLVLVAKDWRLAEDGSIDEASFGSFHDASHAGRLGNVLTMNGRHYERFEAPAGERVRLRFISAANSRVLKFDLQEHDPWLVALDGQPVPPTRLGGQALALAPSQRADLVLDLPLEPGSRVVIREVTSEPLPAAEIVVAEGEGLAPRNSPPEPLPDNPVRLPLSASPRGVDLVMAGGAMRWLDHATHGGQRTDGRELATQHGLVWAFNGMAGMPADPLFTAGRDEEIAIRIVNDTLWPHAMHLHGHHFIELNRNGGAPQPGLRDTVLLEREEEVTVAFVADNPGRWMIHCHMLEHQASGMETWFEVSA